MSSNVPYRNLISPSYNEEELWLRLDWALLESFRDETLAWSMAWLIALDSNDFPDIKIAAISLMDVLVRPSIDKC
jgi:hypothetical protein